MVLPRDDGMQFSATAISRQGERATTRLTLSLSRFLGAVKSNEDLAFLCFKFDLN